MAARKNGPKSGPVLGIDWLKLPLKKRHRYRGTTTGAKANVHRANKRYTDMKFRSFQDNGKTYVERIK